MSPEEFIKLFSDSKFGDFAELGVFTSSEKKAGSRFCTSLLLCLSEYH